MELERQMIMPREPALALWDDSFRDFSDAQMARFARAFHFSIANHTKRWRKSGESYYRHDCRAAARTLKAGFDLDLVSAVLLHEAIEDDGWEEERLKAIFGANITNLVVSVSKLPRTFPSRKERLEDHIGRMREAVPQDWRAAVVKLADRLENTTDTAGLSEEDKDRLFSETESHFLPFFRWAGKFIPPEHKIVYSIWIQEIEFACDNYWRAQALPK